MPPYRGSKVRTGRRLGELDVNILLQEAQREVRPAVGQGLGSDLIGNMGHVHLLPEIVDPAFIRQSFIGEIVFKGPRCDSGECEHDEDKHDHEGARYWVRETVNTTPDRRRPYPQYPEDIHYRQRFRLLHDVRVELYGEDYIEELGLNEARWVTAMNLGEYNIDIDPDDPDDLKLESHALVFGPTRLVHVFMQVSSDGTFRWYFDRAAGGTQLGVVRSIPSDESPTVGVQAVRTNLKTRIREFVGEVVQIACWEGLYGRHFRTKLWPMREPEQEDPIFPETQILAVTFVDGEWMVGQTMRYSYPPTPPEEEEWPMTDCDVVRPVG